MSHGIRNRHGGVGHAGGGVRTRHSVQTHDQSVEGISWAEARDGEQSQTGDIAPGAVDGAVHIYPGSIDTPSFAETIRAPTVQDTLPTLPDEDFPDGSLIFFTQDGKLYRNVDDVWTVTVEATDIVANWLTAGAIAAGAIGADELAADAVRAHHVLLSALNGEHLGGGLLRISTQAGYIDGMQVVDSVTNALLISIDENGIKIIDPDDASRYVLFDAGQLKFTTDDGVTFPNAITPDGINATAINFGSAPGGHNLVLNSSFELADFEPAPSTNVFTDTSKWAAANRVTALDNITEGTALTMTAAGF